MPALPESAAIVALGSNLGDSKATVRAAMGRLRTLSAGEFRCSSLWSSRPIDCPPGSPSFINAVVGLTPRADESPESLLETLQSLEREFGRQPKVILNEPRPLDLDLIAFGRALRATPRLTLPHPRAHLRRFVLQPLAEIAGEMRFPGQSLTVEQLLTGLDDGEVLVREP